MSSAMASASSRSVVAAPCGCAIDSERIKRLERAPILGEVDARDAAPEDRAHRLVSSGSARLIAV